MSRNPDSGYFLVVNRNNLMKFLSFFHLYKLLSSIFTITLTRPLHRKLRMRWFFDVSKVKESSFFKSELTDPPQIFDVRRLENTNLSPSSIYFSVGFYIKIYFESDGFLAYPNEWEWREKTMFIHINQPLMTSFYIKNVPVFFFSNKRWVSADPQFSTQRACEGVNRSGVWGLRKPQVRNIPPNAFRYLIVQEKISDLRLLNLQ